MSATVRVREALERDGLEPRGEATKFSARCPAHPDRSASLAVAAGGDGRALLHCFAGCPPRAVLDALGLEWRDVFPASENPRRPRPSWQAPARAPIAIVLAAATSRGLEYRASTDGDLWAINLCPACGGRGLWLAVDHRGRVLASCPSGCPPEVIFDALAGVPA